MKHHGINISQNDLAKFCAEHHIARLSLFGSVLRDDFTDNSDVDILVEFKDGFTPGYFSLLAMENTLTQMLGRKVDMRTPAELSRHFRDRVLKEAVPQYVAA